jgi:hypothetical protein
MSSVLWLTTRRHDGTISWTNSVSMPVFMAPSMVLCVANGLVHHSGVCAVAGHKAPL